MVEYDVLGNERHKAICKLRDMPKLFPNKDGGADLYAWKAALSDAIGADTELFSAIRDRLIHLLGGDEPKFSDLLKGDDDGVDARPSDSASADSPVHGAAGCGCCGTCGCDGEEHLAPITTELRKYMETYRPIEDAGHVVVSRIGTIGFEGFERLCDSIDAIHAGLERDYKVACEVNERQDLEYVSLAKRYDNTISLPFDKDGRVWRIGDELLDDGMVCEVVGIGPNRLYYYCDATDTVEWTQADSRRHYIALTVEDVLREFTHAILNQKACYREQNIAEYAAKLKLADA